MRPILLLVTNNPYLQDVLTPLLSSLGTLVHKNTLSPPDTPAPAPDAVILDAGFYYSGSLSLPPSWPRPVIVGKADDALQLTPEDIFLSFPLSPQNVSEHVKKSLSPQPSFSAPEQFSAYEFYGATKRLHHTETGQDIRLTDAETLIIEALVKAPNRTLSAEDLQTQALGYSSLADSHTLSTHIYRLRQKIEPDPANPSVLVTTDKGYCLVA